MTVPQRLTEAHLPAIIALHHAVVDGLPRGLVATETNAFFADHIDRLGRIFGIFAGKRLVAYGVLGLPVGDSPNFGGDHGLGAEDLAAVAHVDGVAVAADQRGRGLHRRLIRHRMAEAEALGRRIVLSTAAPENLVSLGNLLDCGLTVRGVAEKFGGRRYLLRHDLDATERPASDGRWLPLADLQGQRRCLADGLRGYRLEDRDGVPGLVFAHFWTPPVAIPGRAAEGDALRLELRQARADAIVERHAAYAAVGGLLPLALLDMVGIVAANIAMVKALADLYDQPFEDARTRAMVVSVLGALLPAGLGAATTAMLTRSLPGARLIGTAAASASALALTKAIGHAYVRHYETGEPLALPRRASTAAA